MFKGVHTRFSWLLPILQPEYVTSQIVTAVRRNAPVLMMPGLISQTSLLRGLLPTAAFDWISDFLGISASMDHFTGRAGAATATGAGAAGGGRAGK
jgi:all-trans-retinol dehydrogenase (NAD+)